jgi:hypothetical protein
MLRLFTKKGMGLIEVIIAIFLTTVGILAILSLQPAGIKTMAESDFLGRAAGILYKTLENNETRILNPCRIITLVPEPGTDEFVRISGPDTATSGDVLYTVNTSIVEDSETTTAGMQAFVVRVRVTWPANPTNGISESQVVTRQDLFRFPAGCMNDSL